MNMGNLISSFFQSGSALLSATNQRSVSEPTRKNIEMIFEIIRGNHKISSAKLDSLLSVIPKNENLSHILNQEGYNIIQNVVGINHIELVRWCLSQNIDYSRGVCSLPLHIACLRGYQESVELLLKNGAKIDVEARMCWPASHNQNCEQCTRTTGLPDIILGDRSSDKPQNAFLYAIDGDQAEILAILLAHKEANWFPWQQKQPLLITACKKGAWSCVQFLVDERSEEINMCYDEYYPVHDAVLHDTKFLDMLLIHGAAIDATTNTQQMTLLHCIFLLGKKSAEDTLDTVKYLFQKGLKDLINAADSLGNTPLHTLIIRYALEEAHISYTGGPPPWNKWEVLHIMRYLLQNGASPSINQPGNAALAFVLRHIKDWEFRYDLIQMLLQYGANPNLVGRDGSAPLMVCLVPLINKDPLSNFTHAMKVSYLHCVRTLCKHGANTNITSRSNLTPLHILMFIAIENISLISQEEKSVAFSFISQLLVILLQHGLNPNVKFSHRSQHILFSLMDMVRNARSPTDLDYMCDITLILLQYGANPNINICHTEPQIYHSQSSVFLKKPCNQVLYYYVQLLIQKEEVLIEEDMRFFRLLSLCYMSMEHKQLYQCLKVLHTQTALVPMKNALSTAIRNFYTNPRTLKQISRVIIYESLNRKSAQNIGKLPLPPSLKDYVLNFEP